MHKEFHTNIFIYIVDKNIYIEFNKLDVINSLKCSIKYTNIELIVISDIDSIVKLFLVKKLEDEEFILTINHTVKCKAYIKYLLFLENNIFIYTSLEELYSIQEKRKRHFHILSQYSL